MGADDVDLAPGLKVGEYVIAEKIGEGGFGSVYKAEHPLIGKEAAIKVLNRKFSADPEMVSRFIAEARAVNQIRHRYIIDIFSFGQLEDGRSYYVMEFLHGQPLDSYLHDNGAMAPSKALPILRSLAHALDAAHAKGIAHRDLKPENIYLVRDEQASDYPKLLDFGIAKLLNDESTSYKTRTGAPMGTPLYMSPEQCRGRNVDHRTDIYAFGCVAYKMLTDRVPFDGEDYMEILMKQIGDSAPPPSSFKDGLSPAVDDVLAWLMAKSVEDRPTTLTQAVAELAKAVADPAHTLDRTTPSLNDSPATVPPGSQRATRDVDVGSMPTMASPEETGNLTTGAEHAAVPASSTLIVRSHRGYGLLALAAAALVAGGVLVFTMQGQDADSSGKTHQLPSELVKTVKPVKNAEPGQPAGRAVAPVPAVLVDAGPVLSATVVVTIEGAPDGTEVFGPTGLLGVLPGSVQIPRGTEPVQLSFRARGFQSKSLQVASDADSALEIELRPVVVPVKKSGKSGKSGKSDRKGRDAIEDPFSE